MRTVKVEVTQLDIDNGDPYECETCPVGLALQRAINNANVIVTDSFITIHDASDKRKWWEIPTPPSVAEFVRTIDAFGPSTVSPFTFDLVLPTEVFLVPEEA